MVQFTVKHEQNIDCGGGYVKLFPASLNQEDMHGDSEYNIMFGGSPSPSVAHRGAVRGPPSPPVPPPGPDICGPGTKKVHVIFNYKGKNVLINKDIRCKVGGRAGGTWGADPALRQGSPTPLSPLPPRRTMSSPTCTRWWCGRTTPTR